MRNRNSLLNINWRKWRLVACILTCAFLLASGGAFGARVSDIRGTRHNLSAVADATPTPSGGSVPTRTVKATSESQVCVFCHTPHGATLGVTPLWNRKLSSATYVPYTSSSLDANVIQGTLDQPGGSSKLCLSCHDGTLAIGSVNVLNGVGWAEGSQTIDMTGTAASGVMASGSGTTTGYTRNLGIDLTNDHPISVTYTTALSDRDGELRSVDANQKYPAGTGTIIGVRSLGYRPKAPLEPTGAGGLGQIQCAACHDPHVRETDPAMGNQKFLRLNRFQVNTPTAIYNSTSDTNCLACHDKNQAVGIWAYSAHANPLVATQTYTDTAANQREFPTTANTAPTNLPVWQAACLNCHDTHTVQGSRWLLREGTDSIATPKAGGGSAIEETCYQCHSNDANTAITPLTTVPNIKSDYTLIGGRHMPITSAEQAAGSEVHDIGGNFNDTGFVDCTGPTNKCGADFVERRLKLGVGNPNNRHAECTDCHNPHRVVKFRSFAPANLAATPDAAGTHNHAAGHTNIASGVLRGTFGVEPNYGSASFHNLPMNYTVKRGDPGANTSTLVSSTYVTREYQVCLKCHSDYGYDDNNLYPTGNRPALNIAGGSGTPSGTNGLTQYTNQAKEFQAPVTHKGEGIPMGMDGGASISYNTNNHRSWHPVMDNTGRTPVVLGNLNPTILLAPWNGATDVGNQTMYCTDCHGSTTAASGSGSGTVVPSSGSSWGPHGSSSDFILKGQWNQNVGNTTTANSLCFRCHDWDQYGNPNMTDATAKKSGFCCAVPGTGVARATNLHLFLANRFASGAWVGTWRCSKCHVAVPHGWKNKALLANLNDVGPEAGLAIGTAVAQPYNNQPYYMNAWLKISSFATSGNWTVSNCGVGVNSGCGNAP